MRFSKIILFFFFIVTALASSATHIRAGEVVARRISGLEFEFTFIGYRDVDGVVFGQGVFDFGDGNKWGDDDGEVIPWQTPVDLGNGVERWQFTLPYTYTGGSTYLVSYTEDFRNDDIQNISGSVSTSFYVETLVVVDRLISNSTPFFTVPPIDQGVVGAIFEHNPGAVDPDDDSLAYYFTIPQQANGLEVNGYRDLNDASFYNDFANGNSTRDGPPTLSIDPITGTLVWDAPGGATIPDMENREFNVAFVVEEWRRIGDELIRLGFVTRDMQIIIWNYDNEPPELAIPEDTCIVAGDTLRAIVTGTDADGDPVKLEAFGGPFEVSPSASFSPSPPVFQPIPASLNFEWNTDCGLVKANPYEVQFKATDSPVIPGITNPPGQANFETWRVTIVGPPPEGLVTTTQPGRRIDLSWNPYSCSNADSMQVWRRVGEFEIDPNCNPGIPPNAGYELIQTQSIEDTTFLDDNGGLGLASGSKYCYRLVALFGEPLGGLSIASEESCDSLLLDIPAITNVDVKSTDELEGEIEVRWVPPYEIDQSIFPPTYTYEVIRTEGAGPGGNFTSLITTTDTVFLDTGLNTEDISYSYQIILFDGGLNLVDTSQQASSVRVLPSPKIGAIELNWQANVPWSNVVQDFPEHYIYRDNVLEDFLDSLVLIDTVDVTINGLTYLDDGFVEESLNEEIEYCYFVTTQGSYDNELLPEPLINNSQIICAQPNDSIPPCKPLAIDFTVDTNFECESQFSCERQSSNQNQELVNILSWQSDNSPECDDDISFFRVYVSKSQEVESFSVLGETMGTEFNHDQDIFNRNLPLRSLAFCYYITAVDRSGNESEISEIICNDNCPQYILPNVFTPNNDGLNDFFTPLKNNGQCPRFVESVVFKVFNRSGVELFTFDSSAQNIGSEGSSSDRNTIFINWNGKSNSGIELPAGVYFYSAEVQFDRLNAEDENEVISGWVQLIR